MITVVDFGMGNLGSILNMLRKVGVPALLTSNPDDVAAADKLILPGVGSFDAAMEQLAERKLTPVLNRKVLDEGTPILGICLGMQLFSYSSEEGVRPGLG